MDKQQQGKTTTPAAAFLTLCERRMGCSKA